MNYLKYVTIAICVFISTTLFSLDYYIYIENNVEEKIADENPESEELRPPVEDEIIYLYSAAEEKPEPVSSTREWSAIDPENLPKTFDEKLTIKSDENTGTLEKKKLDEPVYYWRIRLKDRLEAYEIIEKQRNKYYKLLKGQLDGKVTEITLDDNASKNEKILSKISLKTTEINNSEDKKLDNSLVIKYSHNFDINLKIEGQLETTIAISTFNKLNVTFDIEGVMRGFMVANRANLYFTGKVFRQATNSMKRTEIGKFKGSLSFKIDPISAEISDGIFYLYGDILYDKERRINIIKDGKISGNTNQYNYTAEVLDRNYITIGQLAGQLNGEILY